MPNALPDKGVRGAPLGVPFVVPERPHQVDQYGPGMQLVRRLGPIHPEPLTVPITGHVVLCGWSARETTSTNPCTFVMRNGQDNTGLEFLGINLNPSETRADWYGWDGIHLDIGYFPSLTFGTPVGAIWVRDWSPVSYDIGSQSGY